MHSIKIHRRIPYKEAAIMQKHTQHACVIPNLLPNCFLWLYTDDEKLANTNGQTPASYRTIEGYFVS